MSSTMTPMMQQYFKLKAECSDAILFFRMGDFYEIFGSDALEVSPILDLTLTSRERGDQERIPFCGVPHHSAASYYHKLLKLGYKVGFADQVEDPKLAKGLVRREITRILSPGTVDEIDALESNEPCHILAVYEEPKSRMFAVMVLDFSTGDCRLGSADAGQLSDLISLFNPREILLRKFHLDHWTKGEEAPPWYRLAIKPCLATLPELELRDEKIQKTTLKNFFACEDLKQLPCGEVVGGPALLASALSYLGSLRLSSKHILTVKPLFDPDCLILDETCRRDLELFYSVRSLDKKFSLYNTINQTLCPMGARLLRQVMSCPSTAPNEILRRQRGVRFFIEKREEQHEILRKNLKLVGDLERLSTRLSQMRARPDELAHLANALRTLESFLETAKEQSTWNLEELDQLQRDVLSNLALQNKISSTILDNPGVLGRGKGVFKPGAFAELDTLLDLSENSQKKIDEYEKLLKDQTGISSLKIKNHKTFGLMIEVTHTHSQKIPANFIRRQTMVNCERYLTTELAELNERISSASDQLIDLERRLYQDLLVGLTGFSPALSQLSSRVAWIDLFQSFAWQARRESFVCPLTVSHEDPLVLRASRHPVVEKSIGKFSFVPNSISIAPHQSQLLLTGPNMAGKSTFMRQVAVSAILHQMGSHVPATEARLPIFDRIFTRIGASDDLAMGESTFLIEMKEAARILRQASTKSLVIIDEIGRGTSTHDGLGIARAILEDFASRIKSWTLFATHFHELVEMTSIHPAIRCIQTLIRQEGEKLILTHQIADGASGFSYGLEAARLAGLPDLVLENAKAHVHALETRAPDRSAQTEVAAPRKAPQETWLIKKLRSLNLNQMRPVEALLTLDELVQSLNKTTQKDLFELDHSRASAPLSLDQLWDADPFRLQSNS